jgi:hypothetical protein
MYRSLLASPLNETLNTSNIVNTVED